MFPQRVYNFNTFIFQRPVPPILYFCSMFTGIIECIGKVVAVSENGTNRSFWVASNISDQLKIDQSVSHSGVCLTVDELAPGKHRVTAIAETLSKTNLGQWTTDTVVNLERCMVMNGRLDGHIVQGHVDTVALCIEQKEMDGSWVYTFRFPIEFAALVIEKGSISVNGISLTCFNVTSDTFTIAVIPYTFENTNIGGVNTGNAVNIEFDILGKYIQRNLALK
jgi:riboflavin synthase